MRTLSPKRNGEYGQATRSETKRQDGRNKEVVLAPQSTIIKELSVPRPFFGRASLGNNDAEGPRLSFFGSCFFISDLVSCQCFPSLFGATEGRRC
jgi:hypothetical protein